MNITTWRDDKEEACIVDKGDHPWGIRKSCINYADAEIMSVDNYDTLVGAALLNPQKPLSSDVLERVLDGAAASKQLTLGKREILAEQGLI